MGIGPPPWGVGKQKGIRSSSRQEKYSAGISRDQHILVQAIGMAVKTLRGIGKK